MKKIMKLGGLALLMCAIVAPLAAAQEAKPATPTAPERPQKVQVPLRIQLVLSRYQGEKKISSVPYSLFVTTNEGRTSLRMSVQVPFPSTMIGSTNTNTPITSYSLKDVGTNIDCTAEPAVEHGVYKIYLVVSDSTALPTSAITAKVGDGQSSAGLPPMTFRNFTSTFNILLRDGQTAQYTTATDPVNGEVLKIDATLNVLK